MAFKRGDFSARLPEDWTGVPGKIADTFNAVIEANERMTRELERIGRVVGKEGRIAQRASIGEVTNSWADAIGSINDLIGDLVRPTSEMARVIGAVAKGDLSQTMATEIEGRPLKGEFLHTARTVNAMVGQLGAFASEVTRVAREVGTEGKLGGQAKVKGVAGTLEGLDGERESHGVESHFAGAQHRHSNHGGGKRRSCEKNHCGCSRRIPGVEGHHQQDGGPVAFVCVHRLQPKHASPETLTSAGAKWREAAIKGAKKRKEKAVECNQCSERDTDISPSRKYL